MPSNYFSRFRGAIRLGVGKSGRGTGIKDQVDDLICQGKLLLGHSRLFHSLSSESFTDLHVLVRPLTIAAAQASLPLVNRGGNLSIVGVVSRAISTPSVSRPSFQACGYHTDCLLSEPIQVSGVNTQKALMAVRGSRSALTDCSISNITSRPAQHDLSAYHSLSSNSIRSFESCRKATMSLSKNERPKKYLVHGYFTYAAKRKGNDNPLIEFGVEGFHNSSRDFSSASIAPDVSIDTSAREEQCSSSADSSEQNIPINGTLKLNSGSCYLPHPDKEETGGEDAHFICTDEQAIGVADGVGGWADHGVDAGLYARELMSNSVDAIEEEPKGSIDPARVLEKAYTCTKAKGSSTACIIALTVQGLHAINLGDSGFIVVREGSTVFRSPVQQHDFNFTYQLESGNVGDLPSSGQVFTIPVASGDVIIAGTDGLFDNLYNNDINAVVVQAMRAGFGPEVTAQQIAALARQRAEDKNRQTPFSTAAQEAGFRYYGGKLDDITVVVSYITTDNNESFSANASN